MIANFVEKYLVGESRYLSSLESNTRRLLIITIILLNLITIANYFVGYVKSQQILFADVFFMVISYLTARFYYFQKFKYIFIFTLNYLLIVFIMYSKIENEKLLLPYFRFLFASYVLGYIFLRIRYVLFIYISDLLLILLVTIHKLEKSNFYLFYFELLFSLTSFLLLMMFKFTFIHLYINNNVLNNGTYQSSSQKTIHKGKLLKILNHDLKEGFRKVYNFNVLLFESLHAKGFKVENHVIQQIMNGLNHMQDIIDKLRMYGEKIEGSYNLND